MEVGRARAPVSGFAKVIDRLLEAFPGCAPGGAFRQSSLVGWNVVSRPMVPSACRRIGIITEEDEAASPAGVPLHSNGGDTSSPSQVKRRGIVVPLRKPLDRNSMGFLQHDEGPQNARERREWIDADQDWRAAGSRSIPKQLSLWREPFRSATPL